MKKARIVLNWAVALIAVAVAVLLLLALFAGCATVPHGSAAARYEDPCAGAQKIRRPRGAATCPIRLCD